MNMHLKIQAYIHKIHAYMYNCTYVWHICVYIKAFTNKCFYKYGPRLKHHNMITEITRVRHKLFTNRNGAFEKCRPEH